MKTFEDDKKAKERRLSSLEESNIKFPKHFNWFNEGLHKLQKKLNESIVQFERIKAEKKKEVEEVIKKYEESLQVFV